jgi:O-antigen ligase
MIPISLFLAISYGGIKKLVLLFSTLIFVVTNVFSASRGGFVGMAAVSLLCWWNTNAKIRNAVILSLVVIAFFAFVSEDYKADLSTIREHNIERGTGRDRVELWKTSWRMFLDNPLLGVGQANIPYRLGEYQYDKEGNSFWHRDVNWRTIHSVYFQVLAELGIVGVVLWGLMILNILEKVRQIRRIEEGTREKDKSETFLEHAGTGLMLGLAGYLATGAFLSAFYYPYFWNLSALITTVFIITENRQQSP